MRSLEEQRVALDCVALALQHGRELADAEAIYAFVTGKDADEKRQSNAEHFGECLSGALAQELGRQTRPGGLLSPERQVSPPPGL